MDHIQCDEIGTGIARLIRVWSANINTSLAPYEIDRLASIVMDKSYCGSTCVFGTRARKDLETSSTMQLGHLSFSC